MAYLFPYAGQEKSDRQQHPYYKELRRQERKKQKKSNVPPEFQVPASLPESAYPMPEKYSFAGMNDVPASLRKIMVEVCKVHRVMPADIRGYDSRAHVVQARRVYCIRARAETNWSLSKIGRSICKDHTTVIHFVRQGQTGCSMKPVSPRKDLRPPIGVRRIKFITEPTALESEYAALAAEGLSVSEIAAKMNKTVGAVRHYPKRIKKKAALALKLNTNAAAAALKETGDE